MSTTKLTNKDLEFIERKSENFIAEWIGHLMFEEWESLSPYKDKWSAELQATLEKITQEYFDWFDGDLK